MSQRKEILYALPATTPELVAMFASTTHRINAQLYSLKRMGLVYLTDRKIKRDRGAGRPACLWVRTAQMGMAL